jgi:chromate transporter
LFCAASFRSSSFIGYLVAGLLGGAATAIAVFAPPFLIVLLAAPYYRRFAQNPQVKAFVQGVIAAAVGAIAEAAVILGKRAIMDIPTVITGLFTFVALLKVRKTPEPVLILAAGGIGLLLHHGNP